MLLSLDHHEKKYSSELQPAWGPGAYLALYTTTKLLLGIRMSIAPSASCNRFSAAAFHLHSSCLRFLSTDCPYSARLMWKTSHLLYNPCIRSAREMKDSEWDVGR